MALLKAGAETDKKDVDGLLALEVAPGADVRVSSPSLTLWLSWVVLICDTRSGNTSSGRPRRRGSSCRERSVSYLLLRPTDS